MGNKKKGNRNGNNNRKNQNSSTTSGGGGGGSKSSASNQNPSPSSSSSSSYSSLNSSFTTTPTAVTNSITPISTSPNKATPNTANSDANINSSSSESDKGKPTPSPFTYTTTPFQMMLHKMNSFSYGTQSIQFPKSSPPSVILQSQQQQSSNSQTTSPSPQSTSPNPTESATDYYTDDTTINSSNNNNNSIFDDNDSCSNDNIDDGDDDDDFDDNEQVRAYCRMWTQTPPFIRLSWRREYLDQDIALSQFWSAEALSLFTSTSGCCCTLPAIPWSVDNPQQCQYEVEVLAKAARDMDLYQAGIAPFVPLRYLAIIAGECPQAFTRGVVRDVAVLLNAVPVVPGVAPLVAAVLTLLDEVVVDELALLLADVTRAPATRCAAAKVVEGLYLRALARRIPVVGLAAAAASAIKGGLRHFMANPIGVNDVLTACLVRIGAPKSLALIRRVFEAGRVTIPVLGDYGFVVRSFMRAKAARARARTSTTPSLTTNFNNYSNFNNNNNNINANLNNINLNSMNMNGMNASTASQISSGDLSPAQMMLPRDSLIAMCDVCHGPLFACTHGVDPVVVRAVAEGVQLYERRRYGEALPLLSAADGAVSAPPVPRLPLLTARLCRVRCLMNLMRYEEAASDFAEIPRLPDAEDFALCEKILQAELLRACPATLRCAFSLVDAAARERPASAEPLLALTHLLAARAGGEHEAVQTAEHREHYRARCKRYNIAMEEGDGEKDMDKGKCGQKVAEVDWLHPVAYPVVFCQPGRTPSLTVGKNCFAFLNANGRIEVAQFIDFFGYYEEHAHKRFPLSPATAIEETSQISNTEIRFSLSAERQETIEDVLTSEPGYKPTILSTPINSINNNNFSNNGNESNNGKRLETESKKSLPLLRSVINSTLEHCERISVDPTGSALVTAKADDSHTVVVLGISQRSEVTREIVLGRTERIVEHLACGGYLGGIAAVATSHSITVWHWREPDGALRRGPHLLRGSNTSLSSSSSSSSSFSIATTSPGRILALTLDSTANVLEKSGHGLSLFAVVRESKRVCILEYGLERHDFIRTLLGLSPALGPADPTPDPADLPVPTAAACARPYLAVGTADARLFVWDRRSGALAGCARCASVPKALAFVPGVALLCGLDNGNTLVFSLENVNGSGGKCGGSCVMTMSPVAEICGPQLPVCAIAPVVQNSQLLLRIGYADSVVSSLLFNTGISEDEFLSKNNNGDDDGGGGEVKCSCCGKVGKGFGKCGRCLKVAYCSKECQEKDWQNHKLKCTE